MRCLLACDPPGTLTAIPWGIGPFTYQWSTGDTVAHIDAPAGQEYCVTVTDATGCAAVSCQFVDSTNNPGQCPVTIEVIPDSSGQGATLIASSGTGSNSGQFAWSTGEFGSSIFVEQTGDYCVIYTDSLQGCVGISCVFVTVGQDSFQNTIIGAVIGPFDPLQLVGQVMLIKEDDNGDLSYVDSFEITLDLITIFGIPFYQFDNLEEGTYYTQFRPDHTDFMPTYYQSALVWTQATPITMPSVFNITYDIIVPGTQPIMGPGFIGGYIVSGTNFSNGSNRSEDPLQGISVMIEDASGMPVNHEYSDHNGQFRFPNLPWGTYYLTIDHLNVEPKTIEVEITPQNPVIPSMMIEFDGEQFVTDVRQISSEDGFEIFPNPVQDVVNINTTGLQGDFDLSIRSMDGRTLLSRRIENGSNQVQVNLSDFNSGMYLIYLENSETIYYDKVIKID